MKLCFGTSSAFSRKVRIAAVECGLAERIELIRSATLSHDHALAAINPLAKVPALITDDGEALFDSPVICEYFDTLHDGPRLIPTESPARWRVLRRQAVGDGLMESLVFLGMVVRRPFGDATPQAAMDKERARVERCLDMLESEAQEIESGIDVGCISVACALGWHDSRFPEWNWRTTRPRLAAWYDAFAKRPSMTETIPYRSSDP
ncbi:MAG TPA: glutathione S-transferase N-terminal domain-containing protein [Beijerinckiaceae bacterium]|jgi:glutathione S-transferase|nr:glutathione S-transferase N-terminal domain-containing protein [Beijerinckiaceae bacterium]